MVSLTGRIDEVRIEADVQSVGVASVNCGLNLDSSFFLAGLVLYPFL